MVKTKWLSGLASLGMATVLVIGMVPMPHSVAAQDSNSLLANISYDEMRPDIEALTSVEAYSGWRMAGTEGERQAFDYVRTQLDGLSYLESLGTTLTTENFDVYATMETWQSDLELTVGDNAVSVPADTTFGERDNALSLVELDTDGVFNDTNRDPIELTGSVVTALTVEDVTRLAEATAITGNILVLNYALLDTYATRQDDLLNVLELVLAGEPSAIIFVTQDSSINGESHGTNVAEIGGLLRIASINALPPILYTRLEDLGEAGITSMADLSAISAASLVLDIDILSPAQSQNLILHIPGADASQAFILGANVDTLNLPGAMDNASGVAALLEIARVLDASETQPPVDLYVVWFGAQSLGFYGSSYFVANHQNLLDNTVGMVNLDSVTAPLDGINAELDVMLWSYTRMGRHDLPFTNAIRDLAATHDIKVNVRDLPTVVSDNSPFVTFDVPNINIIYQNLLQMTSAKGVVYAGGLNSPYDTLERLDEKADVLVGMTRTALLAALETPLSEKGTRVNKEPDKKAVFIANHTQAAGMATVIMPEFAMTLSVVGFDVDLVPFGASFSAEDVADADLVVVFPAYDYADPRLVPNDNADVLDVGYSAEEAAIIEQYVADGGFLVITNTSNRINFDNRPADANEDQFDMNIISEPFGVTFIEGVPDYNNYQQLVDSILFDTVEYLDLGNGTAVRFTITNGVALAGTTADDPLVAGLEYGENDGLVLVIGDLGLLNSRYFLPGTGVYRNPNLGFWMNLSNMVTIHAQ